MVVSVHVLVGWVWVKNVAVFSFDMASFILLVGEGFFAKRTGKIFAPVFIVSLDVPRQFPRSVIAFMTNKTRIDLRVVVYLVSVSSVVGRKSRRTLSTPKRFL